MIDRRPRRISSSLFPLNITPAITSIQPPAAWKPVLTPVRGAVASPAAADALHRRAIGRPDRRARGMGGLHGLRPNAGGDDLRPLAPCVRRATAPCARRCDGPSPPHPRL